MKKIVLTVAIILGMAIGANAQNGGLFGKGPERQQESNDYATREDGILNLPTSHGSDQDAGAPLGGGALLLIGFGAAYAMKRRKKSL